MITRLKELIKILNEANHGYYNLAKPILLDSEYDKMYDELLQLEKESGIVLTSSPSQNVGYQVVSELKKVNHPTALLSLDKTKSEDELEKFIGDKQCILSLKMDGLTTKIEYKDGKLHQGSTRGNGKIGEDLTHNLPTYQNVPLQITQDITVTGESIITYQDFEKVNELLPEKDKYSNPRNLASGSIRQLDNSICKSRNVKFIAFGIQGDKNLTKYDQLKQLSELGFDVVPFLLVNKHDFRLGIDELKLIAEEKGYPIDGLVASYNDINYGNSLGTTSKFPKHSLAFKFSDTEYETTFLGVEANTTRTGMVSLVGLFEPVDIDGVIVERASLHNVDIFESLKLGKDDVITVRRANMVIPQIMDNLTRSGTLKLPEHCPSCGLKVEVRTQKEARFLYCVNNHCEAKLVQKITHFTSRDALNIVGLSEATIEKFVVLKYVTRIIDLYYLDAYKDDIVKLDGFGLKSYNKLIDSINKSTDTEFSNFIFGLGIPSVGKSTAKVLSKHFNEESLPNVRLYDLLKLDDIGEVVSNKIVDWFSDNDSRRMYDDLIKEFTFKEPEQSNDNKLEGKVFVVTGSVNVFKNRKELQQKIEQLGGKVSSGVSKSTDYLLNNDKESSSSKNVAAKKLNVPIISEEEFIEIIGGI